MSIERKRGAAAVRRPPLLGENLRLGRSAYQYTALLPGTYSYG